MNFTELIKKYVILLKIKMDTDEFIFLKKYHHDEYKKKLIEYVPKFEESYPTLFNKIIEGNDNLDMLNVFLDNLNEIDDGKKTLNEVRNNLGNLLHNKYVKI